MSVAGRKRLPPRAPPLERKRTFSSLDLLFLLRNPFCVTVRATDPVNIVFAVRRGECGVHLHHVQAAVRHLRVAGGARGPGLLPVLRVAGQATDALVHADSGAVVAAPDRKSTRLNSSHANISYAVFCLK